MIYGSILENEDYILKDIVKMFELVILVIYSFTSK